MTIARFIRTRLQIDYHLEAQESGMFFISL